MKDIPVDIIKAASEGDQAAFRHIYEATGGFVYSVALRVLGNTADAEEVTQEVFVRTWRKLGTFLFRSSFRTWLYRLTMNITLNAYNKRKRDRGRTVNIEVAESAEVVEASGAGRSGGMEGAASDKEEILRSLMAGLSAEHRACIVLREIDGLSYEEMAKALTININTVRSRLKRAREALIAAAKERGDIR